MNKTLSRTTYFFILSLTSLYALSYLDAAIILDNGRDVYKVGQIVSGQQLILQGPDLASAIHLGPWWFYWLSIPGVFGAKWLIALWVGVTAGLKFIFAYALCRRWVNDTFALCVVFAMTLPGWQTLEQFTFSHTNAVQTLVLLFCLILWQLWQTRDGKLLKWLAAVFTLAIHAHPSTYGLLLFSAPFLVRLLLAKVFSFKDIVFSLFGVMLLMAPYVLQQYLDGWLDFQTANAFGDSQLAVSRVLELPELWLSLFWVGPWLFADVVAGSIQWWEQILRCLYLITLISAVLGYVVGAIRKTIHLKVLFVLFWAFLSLCACVLFIRDITPFYMAYVTLPVVSMLIGYGLLHLVPFFKPAWAILMLLSIALIISTWAAMVRFSQNNELALPDALLRQIRAPLANDWRAAPNLRLDLLSFRQTEILDDKLCASKVKQLHGPMVPVLDLNFGIATQFVCDIESVMLSGKEPGYALLSARLYSRLESLGYHFDKMANYAVIEPVVPLKPVHFSVAAPNDYQHPPRKPDNSSELIELSATLSSKQWIMITDYLSVYRAFSEPQVRANERLIKPIAQNYYTRIYHCDPCQGEVLWQINIANVKRDAVDIVYFSLENQP